MGNLKVGDIVARKSYGGDIYFKIVDIKNNGKENIITLKGITYRIEADAPESDLVLLTDQRVNEYNMKMNNVVNKKCRDISAVNTRGRSKKTLFRDTSNEKSRKFSRPGKILHLDGDRDYLETCLSQYRSFGMEVSGEYVPEKNQPSALRDLLLEHRPDILVLTGHDGLIKGDNNYSNVNNYRNSKYFIQAVKEARKFDRDMDSLIIFAGACQSMYRGIIEAGANFASSPGRVLIHALDPVFVCQKIAFTSIDSVVNPNQVIDNTITGMDGIGGLQTWGKFRNGYPQEPGNK